MKDINLNGKRVAVIGSRSFTDKDKLNEVLNKNKDKIKMIVSGGAKGADSLAAEWAHENGYPYLVFPARWRDPVTGLHDKGAGFRRNINIVKTADVIICFWDGKSRGTAHSIEIAKQLGKPVKIISFEPPVEKVEEQLKEKPSAIEETL